MAYKEVTGQGAKMSYWPKKAAERQIGDSVEGVYKNKMERSNPDGSKTVLYVLENSNGLVGVNSSAVIARALEQIPQGSSVKIEYRGKKRNTKTGREYNDFGVYLDEERGIQDYNIEIPAFD